MVTEPKDASRTAGAILRRRGVAPDSKDGQVLRETFANLCTLRAQGRNHIWGYYVRNLIRPLWLAEPENRVDVLIGNPPWLRYSKMATSMQANYQALARPRNLLTGGLGASARDLSTLFVVRAIELYLRHRGSFAFVMPHGVLTRKPHTGFRGGNWSTEQGNHLTVQFGTSWDLSQVTTGFPMTSSVVHGEKSETAKRMPTNTLAWFGRLTRPDIPWPTACDEITTTDSTVYALDHGVKVYESPYKERFRDGAIVYPLVLTFVNDAPSGPFGPGAGRRAVITLASTHKPWNECPQLSGTSSAFVRRVPR